MSTNESAAWDQELAQTGQVRFPVRRRRPALRLVLFAIAMISPIGSAVSASRGDRPWGWWEISSLAGLPLFLSVTARS
jgi:hypothetical protein